MKCHVVLHRVITGSDCIDDSCYHDHQIGSINLSHNWHIFPQLCVWCDCFIIFHQSFFHKYIISRESWGFVSTITVQSMMCANNRVNYNMKVVLDCLHITIPHYHHYADGYEVIEHTICLTGIYCRVCFKVKSIISIIIYAIFRSDIIVKTCLLDLIISINSEIWFLILFEGLNHGTPVCNGFIS